MIKEKYIIGVAIAVSILIHLAAVPLYDKFSKKPKPKEAEPIEVSYIPQKKEQPKPAPKPIIPSAPTPMVPDYTDNSERETTLDDDKAGGTPKNQKESAEKPIETASLPKIVPTPKPKAKPIIEKPDDTAKPNDELSFKESTQEDVEEKTEMPPNIAGLMDTKDIVERIANQKKEQPKGQDTASYNKFEGKYASYFAKFKNNVYQVWNYPAQSVLKGETGVVRVSFSILKDGSIVNIKLLNTSGYPSLDREVMRVLKNMRQTPLPSTYELEQLNVDDANFIYTIGRGWDIF